MISQNIWVGMVCTACVETFTSALRLVTLPTATPPAFIHGMSIRWYKHATSPCLWNAACTVRPTRSWSQANTNLQWSWTQALWEPLWGMCPGGPPDKTLSLIDLILEPGQFYFCRSPVRSHSSHLINGPPVPGTSGQILRLQIINNSWHVEVSHIVIGKF
jgi:hypothetical protein